jgi:hypothetical protein
MDVVECSLARYIDSGEDHPPDVARRKPRNLSRAGTYRLKLYEAQYTAYRLGEMRASVMTSFRIIAMHHSPN